MASVLYSFNKMLLHEYQDNNIYKEQYTFSVLLYYEVFGQKNKLGLKLIWFSTITKASTDVQAIRAKWPVFSK